MLGDHDGEGGKGCATDSRDGKELDEAGHVVAVADDFFFGFELAVDVVEITSCLDWIIAKLEE